MEVGYLKRLFIPKSMPVRDALAKLFTHALECEWHAKNETAGNRCVETLNHDQREAFCGRSGSEFLSYILVLLIAQMSQKMGSSSVSQPTWVFDSQSPYTT